MPQRHPAQVLALHPALGGIIRASPTHSGFELSVAVAVRERWRDATTLAVVLPEQAQAVEQDAVVKVREKVFHFVA